MPFCTEFKAFEDLTFIFDSLAIFYSVHFLLLFILCTLSFFLLFQILPYLFLKIHTSFKPQDLTYCSYTENVGWMKGLLFISFGAHSLNTHPFICDLFVSLNRPRSTKACRNWQFYLPSNTYMHLAWWQAQSRCSATIYQMNKG